MSQYADIIGRLEKATEPSRELDGMVWAALNPKAKVREVFPAYGNERKTRIMFTLPPKRTEIVTKEFGEFRDAFDWTASLDAAIALVERMLPGLEWAVGREPTGTYGGGVARPCDEHLAEGVCSPSIALLLAMFRALEAGAKP